MKHLLPPSSHTDVLLLLALATLLVGIASIALGALASSIRKRRGLPRSGIELTADDRRFLDRLCASRMIVTSVVYSLTLAVVLGLLWILAR